MTLDEIECKIACNEMTASQVFTQMRQHVGNSFKFKAIGDMPAYGEPVLIKVKGVLQNITYCLNGCGSVPDWFEPYHYFDDHEADKIPLNEVDEWAYVQK